jgi:hypothetical protein
MTLQKLEPFDFINSEGDPWPLLGEIGKLTDDMVDVINEIEPNADPQTMLNISVMMDNILDRLDKIEKVVGIENGDAK